MCGTVHMAQVISPRCYVRQRTDAIGRSP